MITTIKLDSNTKKRLLKLDISEKGKSFDVIINELITSYVDKKKDYNKNVKEWKESMGQHKKDRDEWLKRNELWNKLLDWAKSKGFE